RKTTSCSAIAKRVICIFEAPDSPLQKNLLTHRAAHSERAPARAASEPALNSRRAREPENGEAIPIISCEARPKASSLRGRTRPPAATGSAPGAHRRESRRNIRGAPARRPRGARVSTPPRCATAAPRARRTSLPRPAARPRERPDRGRGGGRRGSLALVRARGAGSRGVLAATVLRRAAPVSRPTDTRRRSAQAAAPRATPRRADPTPRTIPASVA